MQLVSIGQTATRGLRQEGLLMKQVAVYASERRSNAFSKEALIYGSINLALESMPDVEWKGRDVRGTAKSPPGLTEVRPSEKIVALGRAAHTLLADYRKRTVVAGVEDDLLDEDLERLVWSCVNTLKVVALGRGAWRSIQMLPIADRRFFELPPLRMPAVRESDRCGVIGKEVLVINHDNDDFRARQVAEALARDGYLVERTGRDGDGDVDQGGWSANAAIHVHVGCHDGMAEEMRLIDTWQSRRFAVMLLTRGQMQNPPPGSLMVQAEMNGFACETIEKVLATCADIRADAVLRKKLLHAGSAVVAPLARSWATIAAELVS